MKEDLLKSVTSYQEDEREEMLERLLSFFDDHEAQASTDVTMDTVSLLLDLSDRKKRELASLSTALVVREEIDISAYTTLLNDLQVAANAPAFVASRAQELEARERRKEGDPALEVDVGTWIVLEAPNDDSNDLSDPIWLMKVLEKRLEETPPMLKVQFYKKKTRNHSWKTSGWNMDYIGSGRAKQPWIVDWEWDIEAIMY